MAFFKPTKFLSGRRTRTVVPDGRWIKCSGCNQTVYKREVEDNMQVCPTCGHHYRINARTRIEQLVDPDSFRETHTNLETVDPLDFTVGKETYRDRIGRAKKQSGLSEAMITGMATIEGAPTTLGVMESSFIMASMGSVLGEKFCCLIEDAIEKRLPCVVVVASGGARMQEGVLALMQMAKTSSAVRDINEAGLPYITVLTDPTTGGVFASFASLGDIILAEPNAYIGFAGARLIEGALKVKIPDGFQRAEYQLNNGYIDEIVKRSELRPYIAKLLRYLDPGKTLDRAATTATRA
jgi:acetyl-CoA carboxylase carboxyl transferase subunit beta